MTNRKINTGTVFERHEKKFIVPPQQYGSLLLTLGQYARQDQYGLHTICSLYYDTGDYALIRRALEKPAYKEKLRLRSYGVPGRDATVYLELKKKFKGVTYKRRLPLSLRQARAYLQRGQKPPDVCDTQILGELDWFLARHQPTAKAMIAYDRIALAGLEDESLRITLDTNIRWRAEDLDLGAGTAGYALLPVGTRIMEVKTLGALPVWLCNALSGLHIYPQSFSKYGAVYTQYLAKDMKEVFSYAG